MKKVIQTLWCCVEDFEAAPIAHVSTTLGTYSGPCIVKLLEEPKIIAVFVDRWSSCRRAIVLTRCFPDQTAMVAIDRWSLRQVLP